MSLSLRQGLSNYATTVLSFFIGIVSGLFYTPFLIHNLGTESYGLVILASTVTSYFGPLAISLSMTLTHYTAVARHGGDAEDQRRMIGASVFLTLRVVTLLTPAIVLLALAGPHLLGFSPGFHGEGMINLFLFGLAFLVWVLCIPFSALVYAANRIDQINLGQILLNLVRVALPFALIALISPLSWFAGLGAVVASLVNLAVLVVCALRIHPLSSFRPVWGGIKLFRDLARTGRDVLVSQIGSLLLLSSELVIVNYLTRATHTGHYAAAIQIPMFARAAMFGVSGVFGPQIIAHFAKGDQDKAAAYVARAMRVMGLMTALPCGILFALGHRTLDAWLGAGFDDFTPVLLAGVVGTLTYATALPLYGLALAANRGLVPGVLRFVSAAFYILLALALFHTTSLGYLGVAAALALGLTLPELFVMAPYVARVTRVPARLFLIEFVIMAGATLFSYAIARALMLAANPQSVLTILVLTLGVSACYLPVCALAAFRQETRQLAARALRRR